MAIVQVKVIDQNLIIANEPLIASGGQEVNIMQFEFNEAWKDYGKTAMFYREGEKNSVVYNIAILNNECVIPAEVLVEEGKFVFGVFGISGTKIKPTERLSYRVVKGSFIRGEKPAEPTTDIYTQLMTAYGIIEEKYTNIFNNLAATVAEMPAKGFINVNTGEAIVSIWVGTKAQKPAVEDEIPGVVYIVTDENFNAETADKLNVESFDIKDQKHRITKKGLYVVVYRGVTYLMSIYDLTKTLIKDISYDNAENAYLKYENEQLWAFDGNNVNITLVLDDVKLITAY